MQPTALVNEAFLRLAQQRNVQWHNKNQFLGIAAPIMRRILVVLYQDSLARAHEVGNAELEALDLNLERFR